MATFLKATEPGGGEKYIHTETIRAISAGPKAVYIEAFGGSYEIPSDNAEELAEGLALSVASAGNHGSILAVTDEGRVSERTGQHTVMDIWIPNPAAKAA